MSFTNSTPNYGLPQYIGTDKPTYLGDMNTAYSTIDTQMKANADAAAAATNTANTAAATATTASTNATTALNTANSAASEAASATSAAASATSTANSAASDASTALRASAANSIENLAPAYDPTLTYDVGDLVTYIDENNSGKLYKCIIAVASPEAFNINKWDDVTTSEVYSQKDRVLSTITADGIMTTKEILNALGNNLTFNTNHEYTLKKVEGSITRMYKSSEVNLDFIRFSLTGQSSNLVQITGYSLYNNGSSAAYNAVIDANGSTFSSTSDVVINAGVIFTLIEHLF